MSFYRGAAAAAVLQLAASGLIRDDEQIKSLVEALTIELERLIENEQQRATEAIERENLAKSVMHAEIKRAWRAARRGLVSLQTYALNHQGFDPHGHFVYCLWGDDNDCPLYVGKSSNVLGRLGSHFATIGRRTSVRSITLLRCKDAMQMDGIETQMIVHYQPPWNTVGIRAGDH